MSIEGRVALVTGSGQGVGLGIAQHLSSIGAAVAINDIIAERVEAAVESIRGAGGRAVPAPFDITSYGQARSAVAAVEKEVGPVDILVNNAGIPNGVQNQPFLTSTPESWRPYVDVNIFGSLNVMHTVLPGMTERNWGRIIQISSGSGSMANPGLGGSMYAAGKAGIEGALRQISAEVGTHGVTVNTLALGLMDNMREHVESKASPVLNQIWSLNTMQRLGTGADVGAACAWLCSAAGEYVTGQTIHLNGGAFCGR